MIFESRFYILLVTLLAFALRVYHLGFQSLWRDEVDSLRFATQPLADLLAFFTRAAQNGPVYFLLLRPWLALVGHSEVALRLPSVFYSTLAVPVTYGLLRRLAGRKPAALLALFMALAPYQVWYGQEAKMYALVTLLVPLELWLLTRAVQAQAGAAPRTSWPYWAGLYLLTSLTVYSHFVAGLAIAVQLAWFLLIPGETALDPSCTPSPSSWARSLPRRSLWALVYLVALALPYLPVALWGLPMLAKFNYGTGFAFTPLRDILTKLAQVFTRGPEAFGGVPMLPMVLALVAGSILWGMARGRGGWRLIAMLWVWLLLPPLLLYAISFGIPLFTERYLIWTMPAFLALAALGCVVLVQTWRPLGLAVLGLILALNLADTGMYQHTLIKADFRSAARYVQAHQAESAQGGAGGSTADRLIFQIPYGQYTFAYYAGSVDHFGAGPYTNDGAGASDVDQWMRAQVQGAPAVWLISSEAWLWDDRHLTEAWLAAHGRVTAHADFPLVTVTRYQLNPLQP